MAEDDNMITFDHVRKQYDDGTEAVHDLSLTIGRGELCVFVGPSGCGKTTTMRMVNRMLEPTSGDIHIDGVDIRKVDKVQLRRRIGYVIQGAGLLPHRTVLANISTVQRLLGTPRRKADEISVEYLDKVGLPRSYADKYPYELSGGECQRVGVARALAADPQILLMDEPFSAVDPVIRVELQNQLLALQKDLHKTVIFVTHDMDEAVKMGDRIAVFSKGGHLEQFDTPQTLLRHPASVFVQSLVGKDRGYRALDFIMLDDEAVSRAPATVVPGAPVIARDSSLRVALNAVLSSPTGVAAVEDRSSRPLGVVTEASVLDAIRRHRADAAAGKAA